MPSSHSLLLCAVVVLCLACLACGQMQVPSPRTTSDNQFNFASTPADDYCGDGNQKASGFQTAKSTLFVGSPANSIILNFNNPPGGGAGARFNFTLLSYRQNGTSFNRATNVTTNIFYRTGLTQLLVTPANIVNVNNQKYLVTLPIDESLGLAQCGNTLTGSDAIYSQTRCVLRYVYDPAVAGQNSRVSCADVVIRSRSSESAVSVRVALASGDVPVGAATALRRLLSSAWATQTALLRIDLFQTPAQIAAGDGDQSAQQIRLADNNPIAVSGDAYSMNFLFYDTVTFNANQLAGNFLAQGNDKLSLIFDLSVQQATMNGNASMPTPLAALMCMLASAVLLLVNKL